MKTQLLYNAAIIAAIYGSDVLTPSQQLESHGQIQLANDSRFSMSYFNEPLTSYAVGFPDQDNIQASLDFIAPIVPVSRSFTYNVWANAEALLSELVDDIRAIGGDFKRVEYASTKVSAKTLNRGLTMRVDLDEVDGIPNWREMYTGLLKGRCLRSEFRRGVVLISAGATNTAKTWDTTAGKDPDQDIRTDLIAGHTSSGLRPNQILFGDTAYDKRIISHRAQNTAGGFASAELSPSELATQLGVNGVMISRERYQSAAAAKSEIVNNLVLEFYSAGKTIQDPSNIKRFVSPCHGGGNFAVYEQPHGVKFIDLTVEYYSLIKLTSTPGLRKLTIS